MTQLPSTPPTPTSPVNDRRRLDGLARIPLIALVVGLGVLALPAYGADVSCPGEGDAAGWSSAADGDFDGDGVADIVIGAPCASIAGLAKAGRVVVQSGATGQRLLTVRGTVANQTLGGAVAFVRDLDGDGLDDVAIGSPGFPVPNPPNADKNSAGKLEVYSRDGDLVLRVLGTYATGTLGEAVDGLPDVDGDDVPDLIVGASNDRDMPGGDKLGAAYLVSGASGAVIDVSLGDLRFDQWGALVEDAGDLDEDGITDVIVASVAADLPVDGGVQNDNGLVRILSGADLSQVLFEARAKKEEKIGKAASMIGDVDGDGVRDIAAGAVGVTVTNLGNAGTVTLFSGATGQKIRTLTDPEPQFNALFGSSIAPLGLVDADDVPDFAASAPGFTVGINAAAGLVRAFSSETGTPLWTKTGTVPQSRFGHSLSRGDDWDGDGIADLVIGSPGAPFRGRRGAGIVQVASGADGAVLRSFGGRLGRETRVFAAGWSFDGTAVLRSLSSSGRPIGQRQRILRGVRSGALSVAMLDEGGLPEDLKVVVAAGAEATSPEVEVRRAGRGKGLLSRFRAEFSIPGYAAGVNVASGELLTNRIGEEIAVVQASSGDGNVDLSLYRRDVDLLGRITWARNSTLPVFQTDTVVEGSLVSAQGATVAVGTVVDTAMPEDIVVGPVGGAPVVRVLGFDGVVTSEWLAYPPASASGTSVAVANLDGSGAAEVLTAPYSGELRIRGFSADGNPFVDPLTQKPVDFVVSSSITGAADGWRLTMADVDLDGSQEIIVAPQSGGVARVFAFEIDGTPVASWPSALPFGPYAAGAFDVAGADRFIRHR